jgi:hypothetical protein
MRRLPTHVGDGRRPRFRWSPSQHAAKILLPAAAAAAGDVDAVDSYAIRTHHTIPSRLRLCAPAPFNPRGRGRDRRHQSRGGQQREVVQGLLARRGNARGRARSNRPLIRLRAPLPHVLPGNRLWWHGEDAWWRQCQQNGERRRRRGRVQPTQGSCCPAQQPGAQGAARARDCTPRVLPHVHPTSRPTERPPLSTVPCAAVCAGDVQHGRQRRPAMVVQAGPEVGLRPGRPDVARIL